ncbi:hypothetical protein YYC_00059 [Plasmodium yoelii 17X]|uniref:Uncharacterized protein n=1 Tax=Plasmodium yoelii 17X TaxID=1323249 RepID=V7PXY3_PLAYE|nr:hypothetical protein YYC_00059 [Plasmodium yoelii 17X]
MPILINDSPEEIYEKNKHLLCTNPEETIQAGEVMNEAVKLLKYHAITEDDYEVYERDDNSIIFLYKKNITPIQILKGFIIQLVPPMSIMK